MTKSEIIEIIATMFYAFTVEAEKYHIEVSTPDGVWLFEDTTGGDDWVLHDPTNGTHFFRDGADIQAIIERFA